MDEAALAVVILVALAIGLVPMILYLLTLQKLMNRVAPENREMTPGQVWLLLIPIFSIIWMFILVGKIGDSLAKEFKARGISDPEERPGYKTGMWYAGLSVASIIPFLGNLAAIGALVLWIMYWVKMHGYSKVLEQGVTAPDVLDSGTYVKE